jgi:hypothetical protein
VFKRSYSLAGLKKGADRVLALTHETLKRDSRLSMMKTLRHKTPKIPHPTFPFRPPGRQIYLSPTKISPTFPVLSGNSPYVTDGEG